MSPLLHSMIPQQWGTISSTLLTLILFLDMFRRYCPQSIQRYIQGWTISLSEFLNPYIRITIHEFIGHYRSTHELYSTIEAYLSVNSSKQAKRLKAENPNDHESKPILTMDDHESVFDDFNGIKVQWISGKIIPPQGSTSFYNEQPEKYFVLKFHKAYKKIATEEYLEHVIKTGKEVQVKNRERKLYTNGNGRKYWNYIVFKHPASFDTLAMRPEKKKELIDDLLTFSKSEDFYRRIGKAWKRGYLLYGPPGTGKSTMIAAMANLLDYDIYDLELTSVKNNGDLKRLLTETTGKSIIVIEDIDCSLNLTGKRNYQENENTEGDKTMMMKKKGEMKEENNGADSKVTLSGLLNFIDGLWSACAGERLIVFTTNHADKLDPALTRTGRMDKHIELGYCEFEGFKVLARNYLRIEEHALFGTVEELIGQVQITPADVAEDLMRKSANQGSEECLSNLISTLRAKGKEQDVKICEVEEVKGGEWWRKMELLLNSKKMKKKKGTEN